MRSSACWPSKRAGITALTIGVALTMALVLDLRVTRSAEAADPVLVGAGDIARCSNPGAEATAKLLDGIPGTVFTTGDNAYESGTAAEFANCYGPTWGRHKAIIINYTGNNEFYTRALRATSATSAPPRAIHRRATIPTIWAPGTWSS